MEVILLERIEKLGLMGEVVKVKDGYARNYLLPQGKALRSTPDNLTRFEAERHQLEASNLERRSEAETVADRMTGLSVVLLRQSSDSGQLYGSVNARDIAQAVSEAGFAIDRTQVKLNRTIKTLGLHTIDIRLHAETSVSVEANVARSQAEAEQQAAAEDGDPVLDAEQFFEDAALAPQAEDDEEATEESSEEAEDDTEGEDGIDSEASSETVESAS
ncbi:MAG: 50S ribosomal protein L9 [Alphaproteobacteria bacterium]|jgi:large subunit ribosomal protein L9|nr:50S ribosomal protein L9 [Rhodospirillaceae bacterium]MDP6404693.1 50S ribosomal protein L9 [Alphaproteobacteria bacterium]MDP6620901.1 50S ribosomal protein L9 [Alphaproteobacteria bacterium]|tara:strand:+ start:1174 stop:1824 length:651 start_codon:yes stop_codon:yes gene_type:complete